VECDEVITNPVSEQRVAEQFATWLAEQDSALASRFVSEHIIYCLTDKRDAVNCVITKRPMAICMHCASTQMVDWLIEVGAPARVIVRAFRIFVGDNDDLFIAHLLQEQGLTADELIEQAAEFLAPMAATL
jgi:hypothetical protein